MRNTARPMFGLALLAALASAVPVAPALAGPQESAFLQKFVGQYTGRGTLKGPDGTESVSCRLSVQSGTQRFRYTGRCVLAGESVPLSGTITYSEQRGRYEASGSGMGTVAGQRTGSGVTFTLSRDYRQRGQRGTANVSFTLGNNSAIDFVINDQANGVLRAHVPLSR